MQEARTTLDTNFHGTALVCRELAPLIKDGEGRIINVCSVAGKLHILQSPGLKQTFQRANSFEAVAALAESFLSGVESGNYGVEGWPRSMYGVSKLCEATYTRVLAHQLESRGIMVNAVCPGWCATDMSSWKGPKTAAAGADTLVWLALRPPGQFVTGRFYQERQDIGFD